MKLNNQQAQAQQKLLLTYQFVTFDIAKKMKELGFNDECLAYYNSMPDGRNASLIIEKETETTKIVRAKGDILLIPAPLWQQAISFCISKGVLVQENFNGWLVLTEYEGKTIEEKWTSTRQAAIEKALTLITQ